ncbi:prepilin peptidase [Demequina sp. SYSU T00039]|uniref:Prepilin leader peptidase/N-methyltransferase n=1 Tax=Demequina lignilytica TaxID=3051663 RepID=A0AAW7M334_9MICO|nr:A24 family peptidase [Demequina sp. SYSU T00039]MDN4486707.1 prepilin peptidase [Demequina sp. SYSU T00039]
MTLLGIAGLFLLGLLLGSFANVLIYRVPEGLSVVSPPSACPACGERIKAQYNVPVIGWLVLRGRCADCGVPISKRYPLVELGTGVAFAATAAWNGLDWMLPVLLALVYFGIVLTAIDLEHRRLPDPLTVAFAVAVATSTIAFSVAEGEWSGAVRAVIGAAALGGLYLLAFIVYPKGMGFGDVKLAPSIGALLGLIGWPALVVGGFAAFLWGAAAGVVAMARTRRGRGVAIPFGPWMFAGAVTGIVVGPTVSGWYLEMVGL